MSVALLGTREFPLDITVDAPDPDAATPASSPASGAEPLELTFVDEAATER